MWDTHKYNHMQLSYNLKKQTRIENIKRKQKLLYKSSDYEESFITFSWVSISDTHFLKILYFFPMSFVLLSLLLPTVSVFRLSTWFWNRNMFPFSHKSIGGDRQKCLDDGKGSSSCQRCLMGLCCQVKSLHTKLWKPFFNRFYFCAQG